LWNDNPVLKKDTTLSTLGFRCVLEIISFKRNLQSPSKEIKAKTIEKEFVFVRTDSTKSGNQDLFASAYETTNHWYNTFLREMDSDRFVRKTKNWMDYTDYAHMKMYGWHPYYNEFPVVNISYKQATHYCSWLTNKYNALPKRKFSKVKFRLPTEEEWIYAASKGGNNMYPWGGPYTRNSKGAFLANYFPLEEQYAFYANRKVIRSEGVATHKNTIGYKYPNNDSTISRNADGVEFIAKKNAYFPNEKGLYNCSGNVAEMTSKEGVSKGGGWNSHEYFIQLSSHETYSIPQPFLGFRVFMEVIEE
jgi:formylglycine-generating enzyme required for sulfatase activity